MKNELGLRYHAGFNGFSVFQDDEMVNVSLSLSFSSSALADIRLNHPEEVFAIKVLSEALGLYFGLAADPECFDELFHEYVLENFSLMECTEQVPYVDLLDEFYSRFR